MFLCYHLRKLLSPAGWSKIMLKLRARTWCRRKMVGNVYVTGSTCLLCYSQGTCEETRGPWDMDHLGKWTLATWMLPFLPTLCNWRSHHNSIARRQSPPLAWRPSEIFTWEKNLQNDAFLPQHLPPLSHISQELGQVSVKLDWRSANSASGRKIIQQQF